MVRIRRSHRRGPGSIPGQGNTIFLRSASHTIYYIILIIENIYIYIYIYILFTTFIFYNIFYLYIYIYIYIFTDFCNLKMYIYI